jgi:D-3-phosphoglycerate dehydrogenase
VIGMGQPQVLIAGGAFPHLDPERRILGAIGAEVIDANRLGREEVISLAAKADALMTDYFAVDARVIEALRQCRVICRYGIGLDQVDIPAATEAGIRVTRVPEYCIGELVDHTIALLLAVTRRIVRYDAAVRAGSWKWLSPGVRRLAGQTLGIIGLGHVGSGVAARAKPLGLRLLAYDPNLTEEQIRARGAEPGCLNRLLATSDIVCLHAPLTADTRGLIGRAAIAAMKPGAILINTARGGLVDQAALVEALQSGRLGGAGLDVLASEPPSPGDPILSLENVVLTPHAGHFSEESMLQVQTEAAEEVRRALKGEPLLNSVNERELDARRRNS